MSLRTLTLALALTGIACGDDAEKTPPDGGHQTDNDGGGGSSGSGGAGKGGSGGSSGSHAGAGGTADDDGGGISGAGGSSGDASVPGDAGQQPGCFQGAPKKDVDFLNQCSNSHCEPFDNTARIKYAGYHEGQKLPELP